MTPEDKQKLKIHSKNQISLFPCLKFINLVICAVTICVSVQRRISMKKFVLLLALLSVPLGISTAFAGSCSSYGDHTHTDKDKKETK